MILIPAYEPDATVLAVIASLRDMLTQRKISLPIVVINDGSRRDEAREVFAALREQKDIVVIDHPENRGKGAALKTGIAYAQEHGITAMVTADADGQHLAQDILNVWQEGQKQTDKIVLGVREFDHTTPLRSRFGNILTRTLFRLFHRANIRDTQTGLRYIPLHYYAALKTIAYDRYEYEFAALIHAVKQSGVIQHPITTVYEPGNPSSHFRKFRDSTRIYYVFLRSMLVSLCITALDFCIFLFTQQFWTNTFASIITARAVATAIYFYLARDFIFRSPGHATRKFFLYATLVLANALLLTPIIDWAHAHAEIGKTYTYMLGSTILYLLNFSIQRWLIFNDRND